MTEIEVKNNKVKMNSHMKIEGTVRIENGDTIIEAKNKLTSRFCWNLATFLGAAYLNCPNQSNATYIDIPNRNLPDLSSQYMYVGQDTTTPTTYSTTALTNPIGSPTKCSNISGGGWVESNNYHAISWTAIWGAGSISGTCGELGLYFVSQNSLAAAGAGISWSNSTGLVARLASADSEFSSFVIDTTKPLVVTWTFRFKTDGKLTTLGLNIMHNMYIPRICSSPNANFYLPAYNWTGKSSFMVLGTDQSTTNSLSMTGLVTPIGTSPGTKATTQTIATGNPSNGVYTVTYTAVWGAGTVSGTCGEIGLYWCGVNSASAFTDPYATSLTMNSCVTAMAARMCSYDTHFTAFDIDTENALTIAWTFTISFDDS